MIVSHDSGFLDNVCTDIVSHLATPHVNYEADKTDALRGEEVGVLPR